MGARKVNTWFWCGDLRKRDHLEHLCLDRRVILKWIFKKWVGEAWTGFIWPQTGTGSGLLWKRWWTFAVHKMREIFWLSEKLLASPEGLCSIDLLSSYSYMLYRRKKTCKISKHKIILPDSKCSFTIAGFWTAQPHSRKLQSSTAIYLLSTYVLTA